MRKKGMDFGVWVIVLLGAFVWWVKTVDVGKLPQDEVVSHTHEIDKRTGEYFDVQVTKCRRCGQTISWVRFNRLGLPIGGNFQGTHDCGKVWGKKDQFDGAGFGRPFDFFRWLDEKQRRLSK